MADQVNGGNQVTELKENAPAGMTSQRVYPCNYCGKAFYCLRARGCHQNIHRREWYAMKRLQEQRNVPFDPYTNTQTPTPFILNFEPVASQHNQLMHQLPHYRHDYSQNPSLAYSPQAFQPRQSLDFPTRSSNRYHPYGFSPNRAYCPSEPVNSVVNYNPIYYHSPVQINELSQLLNRNNNEQGSFPGENQGIFGDRVEDMENKEEDKKEELDLTLHL